jgi:hypothetical protein
MVVTTQRTEIIVTSSNVPIIRSGFSNVIFFLLAVALIFVNQILNDFGVPPLIKTIIAIIICVVALKVYGRSVSKLYVKDGKNLVIVGPVSESMIDVSEIEKADVYGIPSSMTIFVIVKTKKANFPKWYFFVSVSTNCGSYAETKTRLTGLLGELAGDRETVHTLDI